MSGIPRTGSPGQAFSSSAAWLALFAALVFLLPLVAAGQTGNIYAPPLGRGDAWSLAGANTGVALDSGLVSLARNPAGVLTGRNELMGEGDSWTSISVRRRVGSSGLRYGAGMIGYLVGAAGGSLAFGYLPRTRLDTGAEYTSGEVIDRVRYEQY
ncbi:MAG TPA: hypothetical protein ENI92_03345, partial [Bacteroidetes bacterium]|nr:hypothetical protein [Bacteroidota bacterium]